MATTLPVKRSTAWKRFGTVLSNFFRRRGDALERWLGAKSLVESSEIISSASFPWAAELEANWTTIRRELEGVLTDRAGLANMQDISPTQYGIVKEKVWKVFAFHTYGVRSDQNCAACPETARLLDAIPELEVAFFSVLEPGAHLKAHRGAYKGLVRAHLGLIVPEPRDKVRMNVGSQTVIWEEGKCVLFDDTYRHEVWNDTDGVRVVLLIDVPRPFPPFLRRVNKVILRLARLLPFVTDAVKKVQAWEQDYYGAKT